ncbi:hypothetical protein F9C07_1068 [Aspergillus flavus]|uniref:Uncharacterized protein n=1 Tax=Aspergillus flavus (strain ATCC 200026 / FGSC A1120 / IAM 13836 / NRRL 3357 / JCM 12722 / SRRC 167) TaxID=332952 RepID=A0A7U2QX49_ASPFN|nr:hypothetical protein F9C07_1068 [Aspergillus flavus]
MSIAGDCLSTMYQNVASANCTICALILLRQSLKSTFLYHDQRKQNMGFNSECDIFSNIQVPDFRLRI